MMLQVRTYDLVQKDKIFAIGYCFGGGAVLELMRSWPNTPGLLGKQSPCALAFFPPQHAPVATQTCCASFLLRAAHLKRHAVDGDLRA